MHFYANFSSATLSGNTSYMSCCHCDTQETWHREACWVHAKCAGVNADHAQPWVYCVGSAYIIGEEWNVVTFTSLLSCHVVECQHKNALERLAPHFEFCQATQCNNGFSNWPCYLGSPVLKSWEPRRSHWPAVPGLRLQRRTIKVPGLFKHYTWFSFYKVEVCHLPVDQNRLQKVWVAQDLLDCLGHHKICFIIFPNSCFAFSFFWIAFC